MVITLVGLSGSGKSYLARRIAKEKGFRYLGCDDLIAERLSAHFSDSSLGNVSDLAQWLGEPHQQTFRQREKQYLEFEAKVTREIISELGADGWGLSEDIVVDTTGSVIYLEADILDDLKARSRIINLAIPQSEYAMMLEQYFADPKPVIWGDSYQPKPGETPEESLRRCYPLLIAFREQQYKALAEMSMIMDRDNRDKMSITRFLQLAGAR